MRNFVQCRNDRIVVKSSFRSERDTCKQIFIIVLFQILNFLAKRWANNF